MESSHVSVTSQTTFILKLSFKSLFVKNLYRLKPSDFNIFRSTWQKGAFSCFFFHFFVNFYTEHIVLNVFVLTLPSSLHPQGSGPKWWMWPRKTKWKHWPWSTTMLMLFSTLLGKIVPVCYSIYSCWCCQKTNNYSTQNILVHIDVYLCEFITNSNWVQLESRLRKCLPFCLTTCLKSPNHQL